MGCRARLRTERKYLLIRHTTPFFAGSVVSRRETCFRLPMAKFFADSIDATNDLKC